MQNGKEVSSYINDGKVIGDTAFVGAYTGTVVDFTKELAFENTITIRTNEQVEDLSALKNQYIYVNTDENVKSNGAYRIESAYMEGDNVVLNLGNCSLIERYQDDYNRDAGYVYAISVGKSFKLPISKFTKCS